MAVLSSMAAAGGAIGVNVFGDFPWAMLLNVAMDGIGFYALRIILLTVCLKLILSPLDLFQRYKMRKNQLITVRIKPQLEKLEKAYGSNPKVLQQKQAELNRREGMSYLSSCLPMIVTLIVFIWLWQSLLVTANYKQFDNYVNVYNVYSRAYTAVMADDYDAATDGLSASYGEGYRVAYDEAFIASYDEAGGQAAVDAADAAARTSAESSAQADDAAYYSLYTETYADTFADGFASLSGKYSVTDAAALAAEAAHNAASGAVEQYSRTVAQNDVYDYYFNEGAYADGSGYKSDSFLWIKDIWSPDVPWENSLAPTQAEFKEAVGSYATDPARSGLTEAELDKIVGSYETVMARVIQEGEYGVNGFVILPVLAVGLNIAMQIITRRQQKKSGQDLAAGQNAGCLKAMVVVMPVIMGFFALMYCAAFTLYMVTNSAMSLLINVVTTQISKKLVPINEAAGSARKSGSEAERYGRPDPGSRNGKK